MAGYQVSTPGFFAAQNPLNTINNKIDFLEAGYHKPAAQTISTGGSVLTAQQLLGGYLKITTNGTYTTDTASNIINGMQNDFRSQNGTSVIPLPPALLESMNKATEGTSKCLIVYNDSGDFVYINAGTGVSIGVLAQVVIAPNQCTCLKLVVTDNSEEAQQVYIINCAPYISPP